MIFVMIHPNTLVQIMVVQIIHLHLHISGNGSVGDMFMNYMDYTNDACMNLFTQDQKTRMIASINSFRSDLLTSNGCTIK